MKLPNCPKVGDYLKFITPFTLAARGQVYEELETGTLAKVIEVHYHEDNDELECNLVISIYDNAEGNRLFRFNWTIHQPRVEIIKNSKALKLLYAEKK